ncbi:MAG: M15 family metallopeptidase [Bacteroidota bacterium]
MKYLLLLSSLLVFILCACGENQSKATSTTSTNNSQQYTSKTKKQDNPTPIKTLVYDYDTTQWTDLRYLDSTILIDMRYATTNNFVKEKMYECSRCFLRPEVARRIVRAHQILREGGLGLKMLDCFRPRPIQQKLWDKFQDARYVTPPSKGSMHNRGAAVDLTIVNEKGEQLNMGTPFDYFGKEAHHAYTNLSAEVLANRKLLKETMAAVQLKPITTEWWHYSYQAQKYELSDMLWKCDNGSQDAEQ